MGAIVQDERVALLRKSKTIREALAGTADPRVFPEVVDNTMRSAWRKCERAFVNEYALCRAMAGHNIHLRFGAAFAAANDEFRKMYYNKQGTYDEAIEAGILEFITRYGFDEDEESDDQWAKQAKTCERGLTAFIEYWKRFHPKKEPGDMLYLDEDGKETTRKNGSAATEHGFLVELDVLHPHTGRPLLYSVRFDWMEKRLGHILFADDKSASSLGNSWAKQWELRSQFIGYAYCIRKKMGLNVTQAVTRGTAILTHQINFAEVLVRTPAYLQDEWWEQVNAEFQEMVDAVCGGVPARKDMADGCAAYGGCKFVHSCLAQKSHRALANMPIRIWRPDAPDESLTIPVEEL